MMDYLEMLTAREQLMETLSASLSQGLMVIVMD